MTHPIRTKAGKQGEDVIYQPHLTLFGTATPTHYYEALSDRMLTNGLFARMVILDSGKRISGQDPQPVDHCPKRLHETVEWWVGFQPGEHRANLASFFPEPATVPYSDRGLSLANEYRAFADEQYSQAEDDRDEVSMAVWARANENVRKLALIYACSENHQSPKIGDQAVEWATDFVTHETRRMLYMAISHVADNPFHADCLKILRKLRSSPDGSLSHQVLLKRMKVDARRFAELIETLVQRGEIEVEAVPTSGRTGRHYHLVAGAETGESGVK